MRMESRDQSPNGTAHILPLTTHLGARITGLDLGAGPNDEVFGEVYRAFLDWHVIAIPGQDLTPEGVVDLSRRFGPVEPHVKTQFHHPETPNLLVLSNRVTNGEAIGSRNGGTFWHSDVAYRERPAKATLLYAIEVPSEGGDTLFTDMTRAYEELPSELRRRLTGMKALHDYSKADEVDAAQGGKRVPLTDAEKMQVPPVTHPVVRTHPETGRKALFVSPGYTRRILGIPEAESEALLTELFDHCLRPQFRLTYTWERGDVVVWDNAAVMHSATSQHLPPNAHRTLWRTVISGETPR